MAKGPQQTNFRVFQGGDATQSPWSWSGLALWQAGGVAAAGGLVALLTSGGWSMWPLLAGYIGGTAAYVKAQGLEMDREEIKHLSLRSAGALAAASACLFWAGYWSSVGETQGFAGYGARGLLVAVLGLFTGLILSLVGLDLGNHMVGRAKNR